MPARQHRPDDSVAVDVHAARGEPLGGRLRAVPRHFVDLGQRRRRRVRAGNQADKRSRHTEDRSPNRAIDRTRRHPIERRIDPLVLRGIDRLVWLYVRVSLAVAVRVENEGRPALRLRFVLGLLIHLGVEPAFDGAAAREPQRAVGVEVQMMRAEAGVDGRDLFRFGVVQLHLSTALFERARDGRRMRRSRLTEGCGLIGTDARRDPHAALAIHREAVGVRPAGPDRFGAPVRRGLRRRRVCFAGCLRIANLQLHLAGAIARGIHNGHVIGACLERSIDRSVRVHGWIPFVGCDLVVEINLRVGPIPHGDDDVPLPALRPGRSNGGQFAGRHAIGPVRIHRQHPLPPGLGEPCAHAAARLSRLDPPIPRRHRRFLSGSKNGSPLSSLCACDCR